MNARFGSDYKDEFFIVVEINIPISELSCKPNVLRSNFICNLNGRIINIEELGNTISKVN